MDVCMSFHVLLGIEFLKTVRAWVLPLRFRPLRFLRRERSAVDELVEAELLLGAGFADVADVRGFRQVGGGVVFVQ